MGMEIIMNHQNDQYQPSPYAPSNDQWQSHHGQQSISPTGSSPSTMMSHHQQHQQQQQSQVQQGVDTSLQNDLIAAELRRMQHASEEENNALMQLLSRQQQMSGNAAAGAGSSGGNNSSGAPFNNGMNSSSNQGAASFGGSPSQMTGYNNNMQANSHQHHHQSIMSNALQDMNGRAGGSSGMDSLSNMNNFMPSGFMNNRSTGMNGHTLDGINNSMNQYPMNNMSNRQSNTHAASSTGAAPVSGSTSSSASQFNEVSQSDLPQGYDSQQMSNFMNNMSSSFMNNNSGQAQGHGNMSNHNMDQYLQKSQQQLVGNHHIMNNFQKSNNGVFNMNNSMSNSMNMNQANNPFSMDPLPIGGASPSIPGAVSSSSGGTNGVLPNAAVSAAALHNTSQQHQAQQLLLAQAAAAASAAQEDPGWEEQYKSLRAYHLDFGNCKVPARFKTNPKLGRWVMTQRRQFTLLMQGFPSALTAERIRRLEGLGFTWSVRPEPVTTWNKKFAELKAYTATYGNCMVPQRYQANPQLGTWVHTQRRQYKLMSENKKSSMTKEKADALDSIGFFWAAKHNGNSSSSPILGNSNDVRNDHQLLPLDNNDGSDGSNVSGSSEVRAKAA